MMVEDRELTGTEWQGRGTSTLAFPGQTLAGVTPVLDVQRLLWRSRHQRQGMATLVQFEEGCSAVYVARGVGQ